MFRNKMNLNKDLINIVRLYLLPLKESTKRKYDLVIFHFNNISIGKFKLKNYHTYCYCYCFVCDQITNLVIPLKIENKYNIILRYMKEYYPCHQCLFHMFKKNVIMKCLETKN